MIVYLARDIPAFVMYCVSGESGSSLLIELVDSICSGPGGPRKHAMKKKRLYHTTCKRNQLIEGQRALRE